MGQSEVSVELREAQVTFTEGASVFMDPLASTYPDGEHSVGEARFLTFCLLDQHRMLIVSH